MRDSALFDEIDFAIQRLVSVARRPGRGPNAGVADARLEDRFLYLPFSPKDYRQKTEELDDLFQAVADLRPLTCRYKTGREGEVARIVIHPYAMVLCRDAIYCVGKHVAKGDIRTCLLERMFETETSPKERFELPADFVVDDYFQGQFGIFRGNVNHRVVSLRFELDKKSRVLGLFYELGRTLGSVFSLPDVHDKVIAILLQVTPAARVVIYQRTDRGEMKHVASGTRDSQSAGDADDAQPLRVSRTVFDNVAKQRVSVLLENTRRDEAAQPESLRLHQTHSVMAAPIVGRKGLLGVIYTDQQDVMETFSSDDLDLLNAVAVQTGIAIDTVQAHEALQREAKAREKYERFLPQQLVDDVMLDPNQEIRPGGSRLTITTLFGDLRGFTTLSESSPPETVVEYLNRFYSLMSEAIFRHGGTLDKYIAGVDLVADLTVAAVYGVLGLVVLQLTGAISTRTLFSAQLRAELDRGNVAAGVAAGAHHVAISVLASRAVVGGDLADVGLALAFFVIAMISHAGFVALYRLLTTYDDAEQIHGENMAAAVSYAGITVAVAILIARALTGEGEFPGWTAALQGFGGVALFALGLYPVRQLVVQSLMLGARPTLRGPCENPAPSPLPYPLRSPWDSSPESAC